MKKQHYFWEKNREKGSIREKLLEIKHNFCRKKFYELIYVIEEHQQKKCSDLAKRFRNLNGWNEKDMLQFAVSATNQEDLELKLKFLERIIEDLEKEEADK